MIFVFCAAALGFAGAAPFGANPELPAHFVALSTPAPVALMAGQSCRFGLGLTIAPGFHIQANPASEPQYIAAQLKLKPAKGLSIGPPKYPPGQHYRLRGAAKDLLTYQGTIEVQAPLRAQAGAKTGERLVEGQFRYQACDDKSCFFPESIPVRLTVWVSEATQQTQKSVSKSQEPCAPAN